MSAAGTRVWAIQEVANPRRACDASRTTTFGAVSIVASTAIRFLVSGFRETEAYIQRLRIFEGHLSISARQRSLAADFRQGVTISEVDARNGEVCFTPMNGHRPHGRSLPKSSRLHAPQQMTSLFHHLVGADKQHWRDGEAERPCRVEIDHKLKFRRLLDG